MEYMRKIKKNRLKWFGNIIRRDDSEEMRIVIEINIKGKRR